MSKAGARTILVVDDDPEIVNMLSLRLGKRGYRVVSAMDGNAAIASAQREKPDLVVLDVMMPGKTGWEVARNLRHDPSTEKVKIVMLTAIGEQVNEMTSPLYGADAHIDKPFEFDTLEQTIHRLLG
jgi:DNA-binding response OmpR family regulator